MFDISKMTLRRMTPAGQILTIALASAGQIAYKYVSAYVSTKGTQAAKNATKKGAA